VYKYNPLAAVVFALRFILIEGIAPPASLMWRLSIGSVVTLGIGFVVFRRLKRGFYNHL
jgi:ABC-type polysaccharide/polyol phosphate export permease